MVKSVLEAVMKRIIVLCSILLLLVPLTVLAQDVCEGNFDCDQDVDGTDASVFKSDFGRSSFKNPCPACVPACEYPAEVPKTGQTASYATGDDGDLEKGVPWPNPRFTILYYYNAGTEEAPDYTACNPPSVDCEDIYGEPDPTNDMVLDNLTGLYWTRQANWFPGAQTWENALATSGPIAWMNYWRFCDNNDWRLPNVRELISLLDFTKTWYALPTGHPFINLQWRYWSSTATMGGPAPGSKYAVTFSVADLDELFPTETAYVWPVRGGH
jgi:hypothetical protein